jgi:hypothetical protein
MRQPNALNAYAYIRPERKMGSATYQGMDAPPNIHVPSANPSVTHGATKVQCNNSVYSLSDRYWQYGATMHHATVYQSPEAESHSHGMPLRRSPRSELQHINHTQPLQMQYAVGVPLTPPPTLMEHARSSHADPTQCNGVAVSVHDFVRCTPL